MTVRTRFAPSPTGDLHLGGVRTALYSWLYARRHHGEFVLRIEDTDQERSTQEAVEVILDSLKWLGLNYDVDPWYQAKRLREYQKVADELIDAGLAYRCYCTKSRIEQLRETQLARGDKPKYDGCCRELSLPLAHEAPYVVRFKNPLTGQVSFEDQVLGKLTFQNSELDDLVIIRSDGFPTYNFCVVVDDLEMGITHVIRGADHVNNTPRQINIFEALGAAPPKYAHVPLILGTDGKLLSKRHGAASALQYRDLGYVPEALLNYLVRLGWSFGDQEIFTREEMTELFDIKDINKAAAAFDPEKLLWMNRHYLKTLPLERLVEYLRPIMQKLKIDFVSCGPGLIEVVAVLRERADTLLELAEKSRYFYEEFDSYVQEAVKYLSSETLPFLQEFKKALVKLTGWSKENLHDVVSKVADQFEVGFGKVAQPIRVALTGGSASPPIDDTLLLVGKERVIARIDRAVSLIEGSA